MAEVTVELGSGGDPQPRVGEVWALDSAHYLITDEDRAVVLADVDITAGTLTTYDHAYIAKNGHRIATSCTITYTPEGGAS